MKCKTPRKRNIISLRRGSTTRKKVTGPLLVLFLSFWTIYAVTPAWPQAIGQDCNSAFKCELESKGDFIINQQPAALRESTLLAIESLARHSTLENDQRVRSRLELLRKSRSIFREVSVRVGALSRDGHWFAVGTQDGYVRLFEVPDGITLRDNQDWRQSALWQHERGQAVLAIAFSPNSRYLLTGSADGSAILFDTEKRKQIASIEQGKSINAVAFSPNSLRAAIGGDNYSALVFDVAEGSPNRTPLLHSARVLSLDFSADNRFVVTGASDGKVRIFDQMDSTPIPVPDAHKAAVRHVRVSPNGKVIAVGSDDHSITLFERAPAKTFFTILRDDVVTSIDFDASGRWLAIATGDGSVQIFELAANELATKKEIVHLANLGPKPAVLFSPDTRWLAVSTGRLARVFDAFTGLEIARISHRGMINSLSFTKDSRSLVTASADGEIYVSDVLPPEEVCWISQTDTANDVTAVALNPDGEQVAVATTGSVVGLFSAKGGKALKSLAVHPRSGSLASAEILAFSANGSMLAVAGENSSTQVFDVESGSIIRSISNAVEVPAVDKPDKGDKPERVSWVSALAFSPHSNLLATATSDRHIYMYRPRGDQRDVSNFPTETEVTSLAFSPDDTLLAFGDSEDITHIFTVQNPTETFVSQTRRSDIHVLALAFSPDKRFLGAGSADGTVRLFEASTGKLLHEFSQVDLGSLSHLTFFFLAFSPDGDLLATAGNDSTIRVFSTDTFSEIARIENREREIRGLTFGDQGRVLRAISRGSDLIYQSVVVHEYSVAAEDLITDVCSRIKDFTQEEWKKYVPEEKYKRICSKP